jgi:hypothetical protein
VCRGHDPDIDFQGFRGSQTQLTVALRRVEPTMKWWRSRAIDRTVFPNASNGAGFVL